MERDWGGYVAEKELDGRDGGVDGESSDRWGRGGVNVRGIPGVKRRGR